MTTSILNPSYLILINPHLDFRQANQGDPQELLAPAAGAQHPRLRHRRRGGSLVVPAALQRAMAGEVVINGSSGAG